MSTTSNEGVREAKRRHTRWRIFDEALTLMERDGFDEVTIDTICEHAGISRRTFFNYLDSKDELVLGAFPPTLPDEAHKRIAATQTDNMVALILEEIVANANPMDREFERKQRQIIKADKTLALAAMSRIRTALKPTHVSLEDHYRSFPGDRKLPDEPLAIEIHLVILNVMATVSLYLLHPEFETGPNTDDTEQLINAAALSSQFSKELKW